MACTHLSRSECNASCLLIGDGAGPGSGPCGLAARPTGYGSTEGHGWRGAELDRTKKINRFHDMRKGSAEEIATIGIAVRYIALLAMTRRLSGGPTSTSAGFRVMRPRWNLALPASS